MNDVQSALATGLNQTKVDCFYILCCVMKKMKRALTKDTSIRRSKAKAVHTIINNNNSILLKNETGNLIEALSSLLKSSMFVAF